MVRVEYGVRSKCSMESSHGRMEYTPVRNGMERKISAEWEGSE